MKNQRDELHRYQKRITTVTTRETEIAKQCLSQGNKSGALLALRRKKYQETLLSKTDSQLEQLEKLTNSVEFALVQKDVYFGLKEGTRVLKQINSEMKIEDIERLAEETAEAKAYQQEVSEMLGGMMSNQEEDEVEDELEALEAEVKGVEVPHMPDAPVQDLPTRVTSEDELARLAKAKRKARAEARKAEEPMLA
jgi:charged multivesicular body protein 6